MNPSKKSPRSAPRRALIEVTPGRIRDSAVRSLSPWWVGALLAFGAVLWFLIELSPQTAPAFGWKRGIAVAILAGLSFIPVISQRVFSFLEFIRRPSLRATTIASIAIAILAMLYFILTAFGQGRDLFAKTHDDQSYLIQMQMLARGRLWMPQHPLADFFDTFYVLVRPKYASLYFPGAALLYVPTIWLNLPTWLMPAAVAGAIVGRVYRIVTELIDGAAGALAAVAVVSLGWLRVYSILLTSHEPMLLLGLLMFGCWICWRRDGGWGWALGAGVCAGWAAVTRPADALIVALPIGAGFLFDLMAARKSYSDTARTVPSSRRIALTLALLIGGALPFLVLQLIFDKGVTGSLLQTPYGLYLKQEQPNSAFGFHPFDESARPQSALPQKQDLYELFYAPRAREHRPDLVASTWASRYLPLFVGTTLPAPVLLIFVPVGLLGLQCRRRIVFAAILPLFFIVYVLNPFFLEHYALLVAPIVVMLAVLGADEVARAWPRYRPQVSATIAVGILGICISVLPEVRPLWGETYAGIDETFPSPMLRKLQEMDSVGERAVLLFHYSRSAENPVGWINREPVYNTSVAWPDDATVIRAHDLGPQRNREIIDYYARLQPDRVFYRVDLGKGLFEEMGTAKSLAGRPEPPTTRP